MRDNVHISEILEQLRPKLESKRLTLGQLLDILRERGNFFIILILSAPFLQPIALPGVSTPFGILIALLAFGEMLGRNVAIPKRILQYKLPKRGVRILFRGVTAFFRKLEKWTKEHRFGMLVDDPALKRFHAFIAAVAALLLMLPLPVPFSNTLPAYTIALIALGYLLRDGVMILFSYAAAALTAVYFTLIWVAGSEGIRWLV